MMTTTQQKALALLDVADEIAADHPYSANVLRNVARDMTEEAPLWTT